MIPTVEAGPLRVVHIITRLILGGAQENTLFTVEDLVHRHGDVVALVTGPAEGPEGDLFERAHQQGLDVRLVPSLCREIAPWRDWRSLRAIQEHIRAIRPNIVHTHSSKAGILGRLAARRERVPGIIHTIHGLPFHPYERWWRNRLYITVERMAARWTDRFISVADAMTEQAVAAGIAPREQFVTIPSGMEVEPFLDPPRPREAVRSELGLAPEDFVLAKVARLFELKGHDDLIDVAASLTGRHPHLRFLFIGGGVWRERLEERIAALGLRDRFVFTGLVPSPRIPELLAAADGVVHASYREGLARVLPQALLSARPVISYDVDGAREVVEPGRTGWLVPAGDRHQLTAAIEALLALPDRGQSLALEGRRRCLERFRHETMTASIRSLYLDVLEQHPSEGRNRSTIRSPRPKKPW